MKKILIVTALLAMASTGNAASALWKATGGNLFNGTDSTADSAKYSGSVYIFDATISQSSLYNSIVASAGYDYAANAAGVLQVSAGSIVTTDNANYFNYGTGGEKYGFYAVVVDTDKVYFSNIATDLTASSSDTQPSTIAFKSQNNGSTTFSAIAPTGTGFAGAGYWSSAAPEPTSGIMLLLGVGLMAIKRKRA